MKAIVNTAPGRLARQELPRPEPGPGQVRIRTLACGVCATDLAMIAGWERTRCPAIPGHEWSGRVDAAGPGVAGELTGRLCVGENVLADGGEVGFEHPGGYAEFFLTEADKLHVLPSNFPPAVATLIEPLAVGVRGVTRLAMHDASSALVLGDGPVGLMLVMLLRRAGVGRIAAAGGRAERLALAAELGAAATVNYHDCGADLAAGIRRACGDGFANVIEASGHRAAVEAALQLAAHDGRILLLGDYAAARAAFAWNHVLLNELRLIGSNASAGAWPEAVRLAVGDELPLARLISHTLPAARFDEAMALLRERTPGVVKIVIDWSPPA